MSLTTCTAQTRQNFDRCASYIFSHFSCEGGVKVTIAVCALVPQLGQQLSDSASQQAWFAPAEKIIALIDALLDFDGLSRDGVKKLLEIGGALKVWSAL